MDEFIKEALSYDLGSDMHDIWRMTRKKNDGSFESRIKKSTDLKWNDMHGTDLVDIANCSFYELPFNWQYENLEASRVVINLVYDKIVNGVFISSDDLEEMSSIVHDEWLKRNSWAYDSKPELTVSYEQLSLEEKNKDKNQVILAIKKVQAYVDDLIDIDVICEKYGINYSNL